MIVVKQLDERRTYTYSDHNKWIRQIDTGHLYESAVDYIPHTYEETDMDIDNGEVDDAEALCIIMGVDT